MRKKSLENFTQDNKLNKQKKRIRVVATALLLCIVTMHTPVYATVNDNLNTGLRLAVEAITDMLSKDHKDINKSGDIKEQTNYLVQESDATRQDIQSLRVSVENKLDTGITNLANAITSTEDRLKSKISTSESSVNTAITNARTAINNNTDTRKKELSDSLTSHNNTVVQKLDSVFQSVNDGKKQLANTIIDRGGIVGNKDTIYSWSTLNNGVDRIYTDRYNAGIDYADGRVNEDSESYKSGKQNATYNAIPISVFFSQEGDVSPSLIICKKQSLDCEDLYYRISDPVNLDSFAIPKYKDGLTPVENVDYKEFIINNFSSNVATISDEDYDIRVEIIGGGGRPTYNVKIVFKNYLDGGEAVGVNHSVSYSDSYSSGSCSGNILKVPYIIGSEEKNTVFIGHTSSIALVSNPESCLLGSVFGSSGNGNEYVQGNNVVLGFTSGNTYQCSVFIRLLYFVK